MKIRVEITREDIKTGIRKDPCNCPIAKAFKHSTDFIWVEVKPATITFDTGQGYRFMLLPRKVQKFIEKFDKGMKVKPFTFEV